jgi:hypothetical protein
MGHASVYVADSGNHLMRRINMEFMQVTTIGGVAGSSGDVDGPKATARLNTPYAILVDQSPTSDVVYFTSLVTHRIPAILLSRSWRAIVKCALCFSRLKRCFFIGLYAGDE